MKYEIDNIQILRALAALMVVTNHFLGGTVGGIFKYNGGFGVDIFFVISGFLMIYTQRDDKTPVSFFMSRVRRIYPLYIILSIPLIFITFPLERMLAIVGNLLLLPGLNFPDYHMANDPAWTLVYEMIFYAMFSVALIFSRKPVIVCVITCSIIVLCLTFVEGQKRLGWVNLGYILTDKLMLNFAAGCVLAILFKYVRFRIPFLLGIVITIGMCYLALKVLTPLDRFYKYGIPAIVIVAVALITKTGSGFIYQFFHKVGDASYSIYLSHVYLIILFKVFISTNNNNWFILYYSSFAFIIFSILFGMYVCKAIEKPIDEKLRMIKKRG
ncbi:acyltransferase family protein [Cronobacter dublinensis]|uniref:acyltransferase family protein n=1 Tax=Cronobacter dublinensis TaxID=413497 RepID=UPI0024AF2EC1|nr:acyltransferase [Cronobacter dublinensis]MDI7502870.1 acyltransferase [Cronobacter dublinensis]